MFKFVGIQQCFALFSVITRFSATCRFIAIILTKRNWLLATTTCRAYVIFVFLSLEVTLMNYCKQVYMFLLSPLLTKRLSSIMLAKNYVICFQNFYKHFSKISIFFSLLGLSSFLLLWTQRSLAIFSCIRISANFTFNYTVTSYKLF